LPNLTRHHQHHHTSETTPKAPSLATTPGLSLNSDSISADVSPRCRKYNIFRIVDTSRNSLPSDSSLPISANCCSARACSCRRASSTLSVVLLDVGGNCGFPREDGFEDMASENSPAVDDGENVGFGCATPICRRRSAKAASAVVWPLVGSMELACKTGIERKLTCQLL